MKVKRFWLIIALILVTFPLLAHEWGNLSGTVTDSVSKEKMAFVNIKIAGTLMGLSTNEKGNFQFKNIETGKYTLIFSHLGYKTKRVLVHIKQGETTKLNINLKPTTFTMEDLNVSSRKPFSIASAQSIRDIDLELRPVKSSQDILRMVPGLIIAQHAGGGKAEQIFLRGFDCDHGTDIDITVDGIPVNMVSHAHGQGYADLHFLIPELIDQLSVYKGPYFAQFGNFSTAGAVAIKTKDYLQSNSIKLEAGQFNTYKTTLLLQSGKDNARQNGILATQYYQTDGPFDFPQKLKRMNVFGKYFVNLDSKSRITLTTNAFNSAWDASGQIPMRVVEMDSINRFGAIDPMEGGTTMRANTSLLYELTQGNKKYALQFYLTNYNFKLFSNFTYFLTDPNDGDMIEQVENRLMNGMNATYQNMSQLGSKTIRFNGGTGYRTDNIETALWHSPNRIRTEALSKAQITETNLFAWAQCKIIFNENWRIELGLRGDYITYNVNDELGTAQDTLANGLPQASGYAQQAMLNPKFNIVYSPDPMMDLYFNAGTGFHTNDARNVIFTKKAKEIEQVLLREGKTPQEINQWLIQHNFDPEQQFTGSMPRAYGAETGFRLHLFRRLNFGAGIWFMYLDKEFVYVGDGGYSELSNPTRRLGLDMEAHLNISRHIWADGNMTLSKGRIVGLPEGENFIPLAPQFTFTAGITALDIKGWDFSLRTLHVGSRPANENNSVTALGYTLLNGGINYHWKRYTFSLIGENLMNTEWNEAQFDTESRMYWESEPVSELHFTPGNPRNFRMAISVNF
ncbi:MAG: TonB-dependent receptor [Bacteroidales bacterium]|nr:TonB-dependent receptor [Bacteroidales bacterium]